MVPHTTKVSVHVLQWLLLISINSCEICAGNFSNQKLSSVGKQAGLIRKAQEAQKEAQKIAKICNDMKPPK
jgi:hypothetical protein